MSTSSEDVLVQVGQVRYKKGDGTLYIMNERLAWILDNKDTVAVSHNYADIKSNKSYFCYSFYSLLELFYTKKNFSYSAKDFPRGKIKNSITSSIT